MYHSFLVANFVSVIDTNNVIVDTVIVGHNPRALEYNPGNDNIYVADRSPDTVSIIDTNNVVMDTVPVGDTPQSLKYKSANDNIYVANQGSGTVSVIPP